MTTTATYTPIVPASRRTQFAFSLATLRSDEHAQIGFHASNLTQNYSPVILCSTAKISEEEWLRWRTTGIGGSDAGTVLGGNPYMTKRELFYEKTGVKPVKAKDNNALPLRWGHALEETVAEELSIHTGQAFVQMIRIFVLIRLLLSTFSR